MKTIFRYPGVRPFETRQKSVFFGRNKDINDLIELIRIEPLVVLFGRSGYGKSSLINAGLVPILTAPDSIAPMTPFVLRPGSYIKDKTPDLCTRLIAELEKQFPLVTAPWLDQYEPAQRLWYHFKRRQQAGNDNILLVFDQFEEFFTHPTASRQEFLEQIAELIYEAIPQTVRQNLRNADPEHRAFVAQTQTIKVIFSIRADRLSLLEQMAGALPAILSTRMELKALDRGQAREAIVKPALEDIQPLEADGDQTEAAEASPAFSYEENALEKLLADLGDDHGYVEAFLLQMVCTWLESQVINGKISARDQLGRPQIVLSDLPKLSTISGNYYAQQLDQIPSDSLLAAQRVIEEGLLFVNETTNEARRIPKDRDELIQQFGQSGLTDNVLQMLEGAFLIRREANSLGGFSYEISHDTLIEAIKIARGKRLSVRKRYRDIAITGAVLLVLVLALFFVLWAQKQKDRALEGEARAKQNLDMFLNAEVKNNENRGDVLLKTDNKREAEDLYLKARVFADSINSSTLKDSIVRRLNIKIQQTK